MFPKSTSYRAYAIIFTAFSFLVSNIGLSNIISFSAPVLYFLYPLAIVLILLNIFGKFFSNRQCVFVWTIGFTGIAAICDLIRVSGIAAFNPAIEAIGRVLPFYTIGMGWVAPAAVGLVIGLVQMLLTRPKSCAAKTA